MCRFVSLETIELASGELDHLPGTTLIAGRMVENAANTELTLLAMPVDKSKTPVLVISCAFPIADWVIFSCGALPLRKRSKDKFTFTTEHAQNLGVWKVPIEEAKDFPILEKQAAFVEQLEMDAALEVFSVDPRMDQGMNALMSGATAKARALN